MDVNEQQPTEPEPVTAVTDAVADTEGLEQLPVTEHVARFEAAHRALSEALNAIDEV